MSTKLGAIQTDVITAIVNYVQANQSDLNTALQGAASVPISVTVPTTPGTQGATGQQPVNATVTPGSGGGGSSN